MKISRSFLSLGYAGTLPFLLPVIFILSQTGDPSMWLYLTQVYAFAIICFLTGTWWGFALRSNSRPELLMSNIVFLLAFAGFAFLSQYWTIMAAFLLIAILIIEQYTMLFADLSDDYQRMRCILTSIAASALFALNGMT